MKPSKKRIKQFARQFPENGMKMLLQDPRNARELLALAGRDLLQLIDTAHMRLTQTTFIHRDFRHVESDIVLEAPRRPTGRHEPSKLLVYILIEYQSEPDRLMPLRLLDYLVQIYRYQTRQWAKEHRSRARVRLHPVVPIVFYTGTRRWDSVDQLIDLVPAGGPFASMTPTFSPVLVNLQDIAPEILESEGGYLGWVLELVQQRRERPGQFRELLQRVVEHLETMADVQRLRWLDLLSYLLALVYHERDPEERPTLQRTIETSVGTDTNRKELSNMGKTIADQLREEGAREGERKGARAAAITTRQKTLIRQLKRRFGDVPPSITDTIHATRDVRQLDRWLDQVITAAGLEDIDFQNA